MIQYFGDRAHSLVHLDKQGHTYRQGEKQLEQNGPVRVIARDGRYLPEPELIPVQSPGRHQVRVSGAQGGQN